jgi:hypothetical protein
MEDSLEWTQRFIIYYSCSIKKNDAIRMNDNIYCFIKMIGCNDEMLAHWKKKKKEEGCSYDICDDSKFIDLKDAWKICMIDG